MPISCHFWDCKTLPVTSLTHVSSAIADVQTFTINIPLWAFMGWLPGPEIRYFYYGQYPSPFSSLPSYPFPLLFIPRILFYSSSSRCPSPLIIIVYYATRAAHSNSYIQTYSKIIKHKRLKWLKVNTVLKTCPYRIFHHTFTILYCIQAIFWC